MGRVITDLTHLAAIFTTSFVGMDEKDGTRRSKPRSRDRRLCRPARQARAKTLRVCFLESRRPAHPFMARQL